jgi:hypothetical protein
LFSSIHFSVDHSTMRSTFLCIGIVLLLHQISAFQVDVSWTRKTYSSDIIFIGVESIPHQDDSDQVSKSLLIHDKSTVYALEMATGKITWKLDFSHTVVSSVIKRGENMLVHLGLNNEKVQLHSSEDGL